MAAPENFAALDPRAQTTDYDSLPYLSLPIAYTQPPRLAALAVLHGLPFPPAPDQARILELGCASGGNLLPLAARYPNARFVGYDLSAQQIAGGQQRIKFLGLNNIELIQADLADLKLPRQSFDYVICHGVFSWVPPAIQDAILSLIGQCLSDNGVAAISYNVAPGWHLRRPVREMLRYHAGVEGAPRERVQRARSALEAVAKYAGPGAYGALMRAEAKLLEKIPASYILGEFLAEHNHALQFSDFIRATAAHGLEYINEADLDADARGMLSAESVRRVDDLASVDRLRATQELDFLCGRPFRRTLLRRQTTERSVAPSAAHLDDLHITAHLRPSAESAAAGSQTFIDRHGRQITTRAPEVGALLARLAQAYPASVAVNDMLKGIGSDKARLTQTLFGLVRSGRAWVSTLPTKVGSDTNARPQVWSFARAEAGLGLPGVTSLHHVAVALPKIGALLASKADGTRDKPELAQWLAAEIVAGRAPLPPNEAAPSEMATVLAFAQTCVADTLRHLSASAVLEP